MRWNDTLRVLQWRALEESDVEATCLGTQLRREATRHAMAGSDVAPTAVTKFLLLRLDWLAEHTSPSARHTIALMPTWTLGAGFKWLWWVLSLISGYELSVLGQNRVLNLLALPLMGLLIWNAVVMLVAFIAELRGTGARSTQRPWVASFLQRLAARVGFRQEPSNAADKAAAAKFESLSAPLQNEHLRGQLRAGFHFAAAILALGCIIGMYSRGWSREYLAIWESTVFDAPSAQHFLGSLYAPAAFVTGVRVPLDLIPAMQDSVLHEPQPQPALPWLHLYCGTLVLFVIMPRFVLASLCQWRSRQRREKLLDALDLPGFAARLKRAVQGTGEHIQVLLHGWRDEARDRWSRCLREYLGGQVALEFAAITAGEEDEFIAGWQPLTPTTVVIFNAAAIPEVEVQGHLTSALKQRLHAHAAGARLVAMVDAQPLRERRSGEALTTRVALWRDTLKGNAEVLIQE